MLPLSSFTIKGKQRKIDFHLTVFLRSDIFKYIIEKASEPDKIEYTNFLKLEDKNILFRIIEERFVALSSSEVLSDNLWDKYIVKEVENVPVKEYKYPDQETLFTFLEMHIKMLYLEDIQLLKKRM